MSAPALPLPPDAEPEQTAALADRLRLVDDPLARAVAAELAEGPPATRLSLLRLLAEPRGMPGAAGSPTRAQLELVIDATGGCDDKEGSGLAAAPGSSRVVRLAYGVAAVAHVGRAWLPGGIVNGDALLRSAHWSVAETARWAVTVMDSPTFAPESAGFRAAVRLRLRAAALAHAHRTGLKMRIDPVLPSPDSAPLDLFRCWSGIAELAGRLLSDCGCRTTTRMRREFATRAMAVGYALGLPPEIVVLAEDSDGLGRLRRTLLGGETPNSAMHAALARAVVDGAVELAPDEGNRVRLHRTTQVLFGRASTLDKP
jgi:hypothetical protein